MLASPGTGPAYAKRRSEEGFDDPLIIVIAKRHPVDCDDTNLSIGEPPCDREIERASADFECQCLFLDSGQIGDQVAVGGRDGLTRRRGVCESSALDRHRESSHAESIRAGAFTIELNGLASSSSPVGFRAASNVDHPPSD